MGFLSRGPSWKDLENERIAAEARERARIREAEKRARKDAVFASSEGGGISEEANINLFDDDFDEPIALSNFRGSGKVTPDLIL